MVTSADTPLLPPVGPETLGALGWRRELLGVEVVPPPTPPPLPDHAHRQLQERADADLAHLAAVEADAAGRLRAVRRPALAALVAAGAGGLLLLALVVALALLGTDPTPAELEGWPTVLLLLCLVSPLLAAPAVHARRRPAGRAAGIGRLLGTAVVAVLLAGGLALLVVVLLRALGGVPGDDPWLQWASAAVFPLVPLAAGVLGLLRRPLVLRGGARGAPAHLERWPAPLLRSWLDERERRADARRRASALAAQVREEHVRLDRDHEERCALHARRLEDFEPLRPVLPPPGRTVVLGGAPRERGDVVHHLVAAACLRGQDVWVLDLEGAGALDRTRAEAAARGRPLLDLDLAGGADAVALVEGAADEDEELVEALTAASAPALGPGDAGTAEHTLRVLVGHLRRHGGAPTVDGVRSALEELLGAPVDGGGPTASPVAPTTSHDDFGDPGAGAAPQPLSDADPAPHHAPGPRPAVADLFTRRETEQAHPTWSALRLALRSLAGEEAAGHGPSGRWQGPEVRGALLRREGSVLVTVPPVLARRPLAVRRAAALAAAGEAVRRGLAPGGLVVVGAERLALEELRRLADVTSAVDAPLRLCAAELDEVLEPMLRGRATLAAFGGHGAQAAERLADLFGKEWTERETSVTSTISQAQTEQRTTASGRSRSSSRSGGTSQHETMVENGLGLFFADSRSRQRGSSRSQGWSETDGESWSESEGTGTSRGTSDGTTRSRSYDSLAVLERLNALPPYTMLVKRDGTTGVLDLYADQPVPPSLFAPARRASLPAEGEPEASSRPAEPV
ncbi:hypothetical protein [uncultured Pseudokineococcus sp.]|uniref:hypothetical protein n=1 Tax=uncultured Pseudokineococcus sp. TaxID=1642928 RepID=UPI002637D7C8|nr:hypothetical protein [uncultured Pseudokineococcus sp.]